MTDLFICVGARPNFMKAASLATAAHAAGLTYSIVHTGQHYDHELSDVFFEELPFARPDVSLGAASGSHATQTAQIMVAFEHELLSAQPSLVVVVGDVNTALACALVAKKERFAVAHVEAGLRCGDEWMAEEINRRLCDQLADHLFTTCRDADDNLAREGVDAARVHFVGNTMIDTLRLLLPKARERESPARHGLQRDGYALATLHRAENVDNPQQLARLVNAMTVISRWLPLALPLHPRTRARLSGFGLLGPLEREAGIRLLDPLGYLDFVGLMADAQLVLTDSGGVQEETTALGVPCLTLRPSTERPVTVLHGTNRLVGTDPERIVEAAHDAVAGPPPPAAIPELWDGRAGERIVACLAARLSEASHEAIPA
jgi:UDP-N-acetylglucosamine 2-epimerase (non-hydrolysing)